MEKFNDVVSQPRYVWEAIGKYGIFILVLALPLIFLPFATNPLELHKEVLTAIILLVGTLAFLVSVLEKRKLEYPHSWLSLAVLGVLASALISSLFSTSIGQSFYNGFNSPDSLVAYGLYALAFFSGFYFIKKKDLRGLGLLFLIGVLLAGIFGVLQSLGIFILPISFLKTTSFNPLGSFGTLGMFLAAALTLILSYSFKSGKKFLIPAAVLLVLGIFLINNSMVWLGLAISLFILAAFKFSRGESVGLLLGGVAVAAVLFLVAGSIPSFLNTPLEVRPGLNSSVSVVKDTLRGFRVAIGSGPGTFMQSFAAHRPEGVNQSVFWNARFPSGFNYVLTLLLAQGILGILMILFLIFAFVRSGLEEMDHYTGALFALMLFFIVQLFMFPMSFVQFVFLFLGLGALSSALDKKRELHFGNISKTRTFGIFSLVVLGAALTVAFIFFAGEKYVAAAYYENSAQAMNAGKINDGLRYLSTTLNLDPNQDSYWRFASQAILANVKDLVSQNKSDLQSTIQNNISTAVQAAQRAADLNPRDALNWENFGGIYEAFVGVMQGSEDLAIQEYTRAQKLDPSNPSYPAEIGRTYMEAGDYANAEKWLNQAIDLKPDLASTEFLLAQLYINQGNVNKGIQEVEGIKAQNPYDFGVAFQLGMLYYQSGQTDKAQAEFERAVSLNSNYSDARYFLGVIYDKKGMKTQALDEFQKIAALNPGNVDIQKILDNLAGGKPALSGVSGQPPVTSTSTVPLQGSSPTAH